MFRAFTTITRALIAAFAIVALAGGLLLGIDSLNGGNPGCARATYLYFVLGACAFSAMILIHAILYLIERNILERRSPVVVPPSRERQQAESAPPVRVDVPKPAKAPTPDIAVLYQQVKTYVQLEMWELAIEKANTLLRLYPRSKEAEIVRKNIGDLRWKAEPKFFDSQTGKLLAEQEKNLQRRGIATMFSAVKTYIDLEMWDLAKEKAMAVIKHFPESNEAKELVSLVKTIDERAKAPLTKIEEIQLVEPVPVKEIPGGPEVKDPPAGGAPGVQ